ncbi:MAG TPA: hypothetical protein VK486_00575 [Thermoleophilaceae bacterium]|nr:hypothetical protein [Thermoleophilaceae bacterium]
MSAVAPDVWLRAILEAVDSAGDSGLAIDDIEEYVGKLVRSSEAAQVESYVKAAEDRGWVEPINGGEEIRLSRTGSALLRGIRSRRSELEDAGEAAAGETLIEAPSSARERTGQ